MYEYITCGSFFNKFYTVLSRINFYCIAFQVQHNGYYNKIPIPETNTQCWQNKWVSLT